MQAMRRTPILVAIIGFTAAALTLIGAAHSDGSERDWEDNDYAYDRARRALKRGEILPMAQLLERLHDKVPGEVVGVEFEREHGRWVYEFKLIDGEGRLLEIYVDARTGEVLSIEDD